MGYTVTGPTTPTVQNPIVLQGPGLIPIKIPKLPNYGGHTVDVQALVNAINALMTQSSTYAGFYSNFVSEGAVIWFKEEGLKAPKGYPKRADQSAVLNGPTDAISAYNRYDNTGLFKDTNKTFELQMVFDKDIIQGSVIDYDRLARVIPEEIVLHPLYGHHVYDMANKSAGGYSGKILTVADIQADPVSMKNVQVDYELSSSTGKVFRA